MTDWKQLLIPFVLATVGATYCFHQVDDIVLPKIGYISSRACFANAVTVEGAVEMYNLENPFPMTQLDDRTFQLLKKEGYLQTVPDDPYFGGGTHTHYKLSPKGVFCTCHGFRTGRYVVSPFEQLLDRGIRDPKLLWAASRRVHHRFVLWDRRRQYLACKWMGTFVFWLFLFYVLSSVRIDLASESAPRGETTAQLLERLIGNLRERLPSPGNLEINF